MAANPRENTEEALQRWKHLELVQNHYSNFEDFLTEVIEGLLGFTCTDIQLDIGHWVAKGPKYRMVQAQRGQAKTTITAAYAVWRIIHDPKTRVLIVSSGEDMAVEIANWIIQIINGLPELECLRPDRSQGDRASVTAYDIHYSLKGPEKSPSVACIGITSSMQGKRADLLIADDVESQKNSQTATQAARIAHLTKDFISINQKGDIVWLGTPQNVDSLYNGLPSRGVAIRIWTGRYPTKDEIADYEGFLAPLLLRRMLADPSLQSGGGPTGERGKPTDPVLLDEIELTEKEVDQGPAYFQLQYMLSTTLSDQNRYPLKLGLLRFFAWDREENKVPMTINFVRSQVNLITNPQGWPIKDQLFRVHDADDFGQIQFRHMYVDPSGGGKNGDELAYAVTGFMAGRVYLLDVGGFAGGVSEENQNAIVELAAKWKPHQISIEKNYGNGVLSMLLQPKLLLKHKCAVEDVWETGQKELRIIDILEPVISAGKLIVHEDLLRDDWQKCQKYPLDVRGTYSMFWQLARITRDKGSLIHDDRLDAVAGSVRHWVENLAIDDEKAKAEARRDTYNKMMQDPLGNGRPLPGPLGKLFQPLNALAKHGLGTINHLRRT